MFNCTTFSVLRLGLLLKSGTTTAPSNQFSKKAKPQGLQRVRHDRTDQQLEVMTIQRFRVGSPKACRIPKACHMSWICSKGEGYPETVRGQSPFCIETTWQCLLKQKKTNEKRCLDIQNTKLVIKYVRFISYFWILIAALLWKYASFACHRDKAPESIWNMRRAKATATILRKQNVNDAYRRNTGREFWQSENILHCSGHVSHSDSQVLDQAKRQGHLTIHG